MEGKIKKTVLMSIAFFILLAGISCSRSSMQNMNVLVVMNSSSAGYQKGKELLLPYLDHFGIPYLVYDIAGKSKMPDPAGHSLVILAHPGIFRGWQTADSLLMTGILAGVEEGTGLVSFDPGPFLTGSSVDTVDVALLSGITFNQHTHYITLNHTSGDSLKFFENMPVTKITFTGVEVLAGSGDIPLLAVDERGAGRIACWTSMDWMHSDVLGPLGGLDDCLWRSIVWAARKPFIMQGLPPIITMRVDDVAGRGGLWNQSPLYWVNTANNYGLKPWLGLFIYNLEPEAIDELRGYLLSGNATASPHAFGRPERQSSGQESYLPDNPLDTMPFYYNPESLPLRAGDYDEFIFYNHQQSLAWSDEEALEGLDAVSRWYETYAPLPISEYLVPHWYEMGANTARYASEKWGMEFSCFPKYGDRPYTDTVMWLRSGPFRLYEEPHTCTGWTRQGGQRPVYYAGFIEFGGASFFNCLTEIRDDAGYEWAPDNDVEAAAGRGIRQLKRAIDGMALAVLFTHETDYIYRIDPQNWDKELMLITRAMEPYDPDYLTIDEGIRIVRSVVTSGITNVRVNQARRVARISFKGYTDTTTTCYLFMDNGEDVRSQLINVPPFSGEKVIRINYRQD